MAMQFQTQISQLDAIQSALNDLQSRELLSDKQHRFSLSNTLSNDIGNRLRLTCTGGALYRQCLSLSDCIYRLDLRTICIHYVMILIEAEIRFNFFSRQRFRSSAYCIGEPGIE